MTVKEKEVRFGPLISAGVLIGAGMGGFVDGIVLHQILQWHNMLSSQMPPDTLVNAKINMTWDGYFHAGVWLMTAFGLAKLFAAGANREVAWSGRTLLGSLILGYGLFNLIEGVFDHHFLKIHHVHEYVPAGTQAQYDYGFLGVGVLLILVGWAMIRSGKSSWRPDGPLGAGV